MLNGEPGGLTSIRYGKKGNLHIILTIKTQNAHRGTLILVVLLTSARYKSS
jgi:hypothetical protein